MEFTNNLILEPQETHTNTNEKSMEIKETDLNNKRKTGLNRIVFINDEIIASEEICLPQMKIGNKNADSPEENKNEVLSDYNNKSNNQITLELKPRINPYLSEDNKMTINEDSKHNSPDNTNGFNYLQTEYETMSCLKEFDEVLKELNNINSNDISLPIPTLSETEYLLNSINTSQEVEIIPIDPTLKYDDSETSSGSEILLFKDSNNIEKDYNYVHIPTRNNTTQLTPETDIRNENVDENVTIYAIYNDVNEMDNNQIPAPLNVTTFQMEFESYANTTNEYNFSNELLVESADIANNSERKMDVSMNSDKTVEFNLISNDDIETILLSSTDDELFEIEPENANNFDKLDSDGYNSSDFEFITEDEARLDGLTTNLYSKDETNEREANTNTFKAYNSNFDKYFHKNRENYSENIDNFQENYRNDHVIPNLEEYLELFSQPWSVYSIEAENKAFYSTKTMHVEADEIGFNVGLLARRHEENKVDPILQKEAKENAKKIVSMYPAENRKRRRRI